jgi:ketosteroid isomerase-like protein
MASGELTELRDDIAQNGVPTFPRMLPTSPGSRLEHFALRFPGLVRGVSAVIMRLPLASNPTLAQFRAAFLARNEAFNRGDFTTAFAGLAPDVEWHAWDGFLGGTVGERQRLLIGREQVRRFFEDIRDTFPDFHDEPVAFLAAGDGVFVVLHRARGTGRAGGVPTSIAHGNVWDLREGVPARVREFPTWEETLSAAGLDPSNAAEIRAAEPSAD